MLWLLNEVSVLFFFFFLSPISLHAYVYKKGTCGVTIFDWQSSERWDLEDWWPLPHLINSTFIQQNKHEIQNLLDTKYFRHTKFSPPAIVFLTQLTNLLHSSLPNFLKCSTFSLSMSCRAFDVSTTDESRLPIGCVKSYTKENHVILPYLH